MQSAPLCEQHAALYSDFEHRATTIKGVPAAIFDGGGTLEIYAADTTISIYGRDPEQVLRAAHALRRAAPIDIPVGIDRLAALSPAPEPLARSLPPPDPVVLAQTEPCR